MPYLLDTNVAVHLRDGDQRIAREVRSLGEAVLISVITRVALEGGVHRVPEESAIRRARLDLMLTAIPTLAFDDAAASAYGHIVSRSGYSRRKLLDRMIAAQALVHRATLVTMNRADFSDIEGLTLLTW